MTEIVKAIIEILILWSVIYHALLFFEGTRALQVLRGIIILIVAFFVFQKLELYVLEWILIKIFAISIIGILIIFHPEIRQGLARLGRRHIFNTPLQEEELDRIISEIRRAVENLCKNKVGALIAIEKTSGTLNGYSETGVVVDGKITTELIENIFMPNSPLHDGGVIIQNGRIQAAGCLFPLTKKTDLDRMFGTRHRAALGLSEETDAVIIIVSEERHDVSLVCDAKFYKDLPFEEMVIKLKNLIKNKNENT